MPPPRRLSIVRESFALLFIAQLAKIPRPILRDALKITKMRHKASKSAWERVRSLCMRSVSESNVAPFGDDGTIGICIRSTNDSVTPPILAPFLWTIGGQGGCQVRRSQDSTFYIIHFSDLRNKFPGGKIRPFRAC